MGTGVLAIKLVQEALKNTRPNTEACRLLEGLRKEIKLKIETGHELEKPANQYCRICGLPMFTDAAKRRCHEN
jgi:hypothetical protein